VTRHRHVAMDLDRLIDPHADLVQDRADDLLTFSIGKFGQPPSRLFDDAPEQVVALFVGQLPLKPGKDGPVFILKDLTLAGEAVQAQARLLERGVALDIRQFFRSEPDGAPLSKAAMSSRQDVYGGRYPRSRLTVQLPRVACGGRGVRRVGDRDARGGRTAPLAG